MVRYVLFALLASATLGSVAHAEPLNTRQVRRMIAVKGDPIPVLATVSNRSDDGEAEAAASSSESRILVVVDGMLVEMHPEMVAALIRSGIFKVIGRLPADFEQEYGPFWPDPGEDPRYP